MCRSRPDHLTPGKGEGLDLAIIQCAPFQAYLTACRHLLIAREHRRWSVDVESSHRDFAVEEAGPKGARLERRRALDEERTPGSNVAVGSGRSSATTTNPPPQAATPVFSPSTFTGNTPVTVTVTSVLQMARADMAVRAPQRRRHRPTARASALCSFSRWTKWLSVS